MNWDFKREPAAEQSQTLSRAIGVSRLIADLLVQRGITNFEQAKKYFRPQLADLHDPFLMHDMDIAVARVEDALKKGERIMVYGDYDVDGTSAVALMSDYLSKFTDNIINYVPCRYAEGYGVSTKGIEKAKEKDVRLIIALDCGITAIDQVAYAKSSGIDMIICDHHQVGEVLPNAVAVLNPHRKDCHYPCKALCGAGVGFKLIQAHNQIRQRSIENIAHALQWVAIAIAADIVPMTGENRVLCFYGLQYINENPKMPIALFKDAYQIPIWTVTDLVFKIAPKINAAGRIDHGSKAVTLLKGKDPTAAAAIFQEINENNDLRKATEQQVTLEALEQLKNTQQETDATTVVVGKNWHKGVLGIVASRLIETHYKPTIVLVQQGDKMMGSARSVAGFNVYEALCKCERYLEKFGGHAAAAGLCLKAKNYINFKALFEKVAHETIAPESKEPRFSIDAQITLKELTDKNWRIIKQMAPFGPKHRRPVFCSRNLKHVGDLRLLGEDQSHLKMSVYDPETPDLIFSCIGFGLAKGARKQALLNSTPKTSFDLVYSLEENHWQGVTTLQLAIKDLKLNTQKNRHRKSVAG